MIILRENLKANGNALQLVIVPMVFTSIALAMCKISDTKKLGRISYKTILGFLVTSGFALALAGAVGFIIKNLGLFTANVENVTAQAGVASSTNLLLIIVQAIPNNITAAFSTNGSILAVVFVAVVLGLCINTLGEKIKVLITLLEEINSIITVFLSFIITKFGPAAILPLNTKTTIEELGVSEDIASFILPLGMTVNMNGTAIIQVIAAIFIATSAGYYVSIGNIVVIALLALIASVGTPAAPGAGAIILFTVLTGMGYNNDAAILAYSLILAINRPIEMLVTYLNVVGDSATSVVVAKLEGMLEEEVYNIIYISFYIKKDN